MRAHLSLVRHADPQRGDDDPSPLPDERGPHFPMLRDQ